MHWYEVVLLIPIVAAFAAGVWAVARRKWYGIVPAVALGLAGALTALAPANDYTQRFWRGAELVQSAPAEQLAMTWLLASAAVLVSVVALWAGYSRSHWFWRLSAFAGVLALLGWSEANEPILLCLATMPVMSGGAYLLRRRQNQGSSPASEPLERRGTARFRWPLRDAFGAFVVIGLLAVSLRSLASADLYLVPGDLAVTAVTFALVTLAAAGSGLAMQTGRRWSCGLLTLLLIVAGTIVHGGLGCDALGLAFFIEGGSSPAFDRIVFLAVGLASLAASLVVIGNLYAIAMRSTRAAARWTAAICLVVVLAAIVVPWVMVYPWLLPPVSRIAPPQPSATYAQIQSAGQKATGLRAPGYQTGPALQEAREALAEPGNVWFNAVEFRQNELSLRYDMSFQREQMLAGLIDFEISKAEQAGRSAESLDLAILQFRLGRVLRRGGICVNWIVGSHAERFGCGAISEALDKLSDDDCQRALAELRKTLTDRPDIETILAYDAYWKRAFYGWRNELFRASRRLAGEEPGRITVDWGSRAEIEIFDRRALTRLRLLEARLGIELFRREHAEWPARLDELIPQYLATEPADPYGSGPLVYRRDKESFLLYSVGPDGNDDGGKFSSHPREQKFEGLDIDWEFDRRIQAEKWPRKP